MGRTHCPWGRERQTEDIWGAGEGGGPERVEPSTFSAPGPKQPTWRGQAKGVGQGAHWATRGDCGRIDSFGKYLWRAYYVPGAVLSHGWSPQAQRQGRGSVWPAGEGACKGVETGPQLSPAPGRAGSRTQVLGGSSGAGRQAQAEVGSRGWTNWSGGKGQYGAWWVTGPRKYKMEVNTAPPRR